MARRTTTKRSSKRQSRNRSVAAPATLPFIEHLNELRRRLFYVAVSVGIFSCAAYGVQQHIVNLLLRPSHGQEFIYTSPGGGLNFLLQVCLYTGLIFSIPVIVYQILKYVEPLIPHSVAFIKYGSAVSGALAAAGIAFGYYVGLPSALHFLLHQFTTLQIKPLVTIQSYMSFVLVYMLGSALLFQIPLIVLFINRIKPLQPRTLFKYERWVILVSFVLSVLLNPTPNIIDQLLLAGPIILSYQFTILLVALINRPKRSPKVRTLLEHDRQVRNERLARARLARPLQSKPPVTATPPAPVHAKPASALPAISLSTATPSATPPFQQPVLLRSSSVAAARRQTRSQKYMNGFIDFHQPRSTHTFIDLARFDSTEEPNA